jgi:hypothetical protein
MKRSLVLLLAGLSLLPAVCHGGQTAQARMYCLSLRFQQGHSANFVSTLDLTSIAPSINGELAPWWGGSYDQITQFVLNDPTLYEPITGTLAVNLPLTTDANGNGFPDFFETSQDASGTTAGAFATAISQGTVQATWSRAATSKDGTCKLQGCSKVGRGG